MSTADSIDRLSRQLEQALGSAAIPPRYRRLGAQLLTQLRRPVQVSVVGLGQSGKTSLVNMFLGGQVVPAIPRASIVEAVYGSEPRTVLEYGDGTIDQVEGLITEPPGLDDPFRIRLEMPEDRLRTQSFAEVTLAGPDARLRALLDYVETTSAIVVWSSETFNVKEQALWRAVPDHVKDRGFLALTMADRHQMKGTLKRRIAELEDIVAEEFYGLYPVATLQAIKARAGGGAEMSRLWALSGGEALCDVIDRQIALGRGEDLDQVRALLDEIVTEAPSAAPKRESAAPRAAAPAPVVEPVTGESRDAFRRTLRLLQADAEKMLADLPAGGPPDYAAVLEECIGTIREMSDMLSDAAEADPSAAGLLEDIREGEDMLLLLQLEKSEDAAADAVSLMLQLKKEVSARACA